MSTSRKRCIYTPRGVILGIALSLSIICSTVIGANASPCPLPVIPVGRYVGGMAKAIHIELIISDGGMGSMTLYMERLKCGVDGSDDCQDDDDDDDESGLVLERRLVKIPQLIYKYDNVTCSLGFVENITSIPALAASQVDSNPPEMKTLSTLHDVYAFMTDQLSDSLRSNLPSNLEAKLTDPGTIEMMGILPVSLSSHETDWVAFIEAPYFESDKPLPIPGEFHKILELDVGTPSLIVASTTKSVCPVSAYGWMGVLTLISLCL
jgi:hypothetical protein